MPELVASRIVPSPRSMAACTKSAAWLPPDVAATMIWSYHAPELWNRRRSPRAMWGVLDLGEVYFGGDACVAGGRAGDGVADADHRLGDGGLAETVLAGSRDGGARCDREPVHTVEAGVEEDGHGGGGAGRGVGDVDAHRDEAMLAVVDEYGAGRFGRTCGIAPLTEAEGADGHGTWGFLWGGDLCGDDVLLAHCVVGREGGGAGDRDGASGHAGAGHQREGDDVDDLAGGVQRAVDARTEEGQLHAGPLSGLVDEADAEAGVCVAEGDSSPAATIPIEVHLGDEEPTARVDGFDVRDVAQPACALDAGGKDDSRADCGGIADAETARSGAVGPVTCVTEVGDLAAGPIGCVPRALAERVAKHADA